MIATFGDFDVGKVPRRQTKPWRGVVRDVRGPEVDFHRGRDGAGGGLREACGVWPEGGAVEDRPGPPESVRPANAFLRFAWRRRPVPGQVSETRGHLRSGVARSAFCLSRSPGPALQGFPDNDGNLRDLVDAHERIHLGQELRQLVTIPLRQTPCDNKRLASIVRLPHLRRFEDGVHALLLRGVDERTGIDDDRVRACGVVGDLDAVVEQ